MTHDELVHRAVKWLRGTMRCPIVYAEMVTAARSIPDAIGWKYRSVHLVECKTSRADLMRDRHKPSHRDGYVMGTHRWYMTPIGLLAPEEVPDGWGLLEVHTKITRKVVEAPYVERTTKAMMEEAILLQSAIRRHRLGISYTKSKGRFKRSG